MEAARSLGQLKPKGPTRLHPKILNTKLDGWVGGGDGDRSGPHTAGTRAVPTPLYSIAVRTRLPRHSSGSYTAAPPYVRRVRVLVARPAGRAACGGFPDDPIGAPKVASSPAPSSSAVQPGCPHEVASRVSCRALVACVPVACRARLACVRVACRARVAALAACAPRSGDIRGPLTEQRCEAVHYERMQSCSFVGLATRHALLFCGSAEPRTHLLNIETRDGAPIDEGLLRAIGELALH